VYSVVRIAIRRFYKIIYVYVRVRARGFFFFLENHEKQQVQRVYMCNRIAAFARRTTRTMYTERKPVDRAIDKLTPFCQSILDTRDWRRTSGSLPIVTIFVFGALSNQRIERGEKGSISRRTVYKRHNVSSFRRLKSFVKLVYTYVVLYKLHI